MLNLAGDNSAEKFMHIYSNWLQNTPQYIQTHEYPIAQTVTEFYVISLLY